jgi:drug/metabolite transporter (DMT)-like permease
MVLGYFLLQRRYSRTHYFAAFCLCVGLVGITLSDDRANIPVTTSAQHASLSSPHTSSSSSGTLLGASLLLGSIILDAAIPNLQEMLLAPREAFAFDGHVPTFNQVMLFSNIFGVAILVVPLLAFGHFFEAIAFIADGNTHVRNVCPIDRSTKHRHSRHACYHSAHSL